MKQFGAAAPAVSEAEKQLVGNNDLDMQFIKVSQEIAIGGIKIDDIKESDTYFATLDDESTVEIHLMDNQIQLDIYKNHDKADNSHMWHILFNTQKFQIINMYTNTRHSALKLILKKNDGGSNEEGLTFRNNEFFNLQKAARIISYLFYDKNNKDPENRDAIITKIKELQEKASQPTQELQNTQYSNIMVYVGGSPD